MEKLKIVLQPKPKKLVKSFGLTDVAVNKLLKISKKTGLSSSEIVNQILVSIEV